jgi:hypothetical protein
MCKQSPSNCMMFTIMSNPIDGGESFTLCHVVIGVYRSSWTSNHNKRYQDLVTQLSDQRLHLQLMLAAGHFDPNPVRLCQT